MDTYKEKLDAIVEEVVTEKTFSLEVVNRIKALKDEFELLQKDHKKVQEDLKEERKVHKETAEERNTLKTALEESTKRLEAWETRAKDIIARETKQTLVEQRAEFADRNTQNIYNLAALVFRNPTFVTNSQEDTVHVPQINQNGTQTYPITIPTKKRVEKTIE